MRAAEVDPISTAKIEGVESSRIALRIMLKLGWEPGQTLGINNSGLRSPISTEGQTDRKGLGSGGCIEKNIIINLLTKSELKANESWVEPEEITAASLFDEEDQIISKSTEISRSEFYIKIFGEKVLCLLDTGCDISCISEDFWENIKGRSDKIPLLPIKPIQIRGAIGQKSAKVQQMILLPVNIQGEDIDTHFLIVPNLIRPVIIGFDWLVKHGILLNLHGPEKGIRIIKNNKSIFAPLGTGDFYNLDVCKILTCQNQMSFVENIRTGISLQQVQLHKLNSVLVKHGRIFTEKLGKCKCYSHEIKMSNQTPFIKRSYPVPYAYRCKMESKLQEMEETGIISRASTPYCSPLTFTVKPDGSLRVLLDAREINKYMVAESEVPPMQLDILNSFHGVRFISVIDLNNAYFQIPISENSGKYHQWQIVYTMYCHKILRNLLEALVEPWT